jgi:hypothetical protein
MKTAVEWLQIKMATSSTEEMVENINVWFEEAKEMEKEQKKELIIATYTDLKMKDCQLPYGMQYHNELLKAGEEAEQYYNETFKQQEQ